jgi:hypothetical protein
VSTPLREAVSDQLALSRAQAVARAGDMDEALRLLESVSTATVPVLDLRARVQAQRGELAGADESWAAVLRLDPDDRAARAGRAAIARIRSGGASRPLLRPVRVSGLALVLVAGAIVGLVAIPRGSGPAPTPAPPDPAVARLQGQLASLRASSAASSSAAARRLDALAARFVLPGVRVERRSSEVQLVFETGIFRSGTSLAPGSAELLASVGKRLKGVSTTVVGHAVAVPGGVTSGGSLVAYERAEVAARLLSRASGLPLTAFALATADQSDSPFPDARRTRTVTLLLRP